ncbi:DUF4870 domain-containing protein [Catenuloplanes japonicus]|uniref:DUF4870 domain-containing protein n=1 Tax=Catenuloplanes japonicus TaxID=33876 RepID=UPI000526D7D7|nr:DUF4870 domain-containing protein [Catenuloplanes japonicus]
MSEPPRPPGEGIPGSNDPYSTPPQYDSTPPTSGAGGYPPPTSGAGAYPPGAGAYPPPTSGAGAYPPPTSGAGAYPPPGGDPNAYPPAGGGYGAPPGGGYQQPYGQPGYPGGAAKGNFVGDEKTWVLLSHAGGIIFGFLAPLVVMLAKGNESQTIRAHAVEALNFQITWGVAMLVAVILSICSLGILSFLPFIVWIVVLVFGILATIKVNDGEWYTYPVTYRIVK